MMSLYEGSRTKVRVVSGTSEEFWVRVGVHQGSVLLPLIFAIVADVVTEHAREGLHSSTKKIFLFAQDISTVLGYIRCADSENGLLFAALALVFEVYPLLINNGKIYYR